MNIRRNFGSNDSYTNGAPLQKKYALATASGEHKAHAKVKRNEPKQQALPRFEDQRQMIGGGMPAPAHTRKTSETFSLRDARFGPHAVNENAALHARSAMQTGLPPEEDDSYSLNDFH